jgi:DNA-binding transcriptional ArsR family regulator
LGGVFEALADPNRRVLLELLSAGEQPAGALVAALQARGPISQPAVSQHLRVLREAGLVAVRAEGSRRLYALDPAGVERARAWLTALRDPLAGAAQPLDALETELARGRRAARRAGATARDGAARRVAER